MSGGQRVLWTDDDVLTILWRHRVKRQTASQLALSFGTTRSAICGLVHRIEVAVAGVDIDRLGDGVLLGILDQVRGDGRPADAVGRAFGIERNAVLGLVHALMVEVAGPGDAVRPENRNGGMDRHWYRDGLVSRGMAA